MNMDVLLRRLKQTIWGLKHLKRRCISCPGLAEKKDINIVDAKPFDSIPGPMSLPVIGTLWKYLPLIGEYKFSCLPMNGLRKLRRYGPVVREDIVPGVPVVWVYTPADIETVYRCEGRYPERRSHLALQKYRQDRPNIYNTGGLLPTNGEEWWRLRSMFQRSLSRVQDVRSHLSVTDEILQEFTKFAASDSAVADFLPKLSRLYLELTCMVAFSARLDSFSKSEQAADSRSSRLIWAAETTNSCILRTDNGPQLWRRWRTPLYRKLERGCLILERAAIELVSNLQCQSDDLRGSSLVAQYLACSDIDIKDIHGMAVDLILAGIDTTTYSSCFALYHLACNSSVQERLHEEASRLLPSVSDSVTAETLTHAAYTRAVVKETLRLNPVSVGVGRILAKDAVFSGYHVPAGTVVVTQNQVTCRLEEYFPQAEQFTPERWLKSTGENVQGSLSPYLVLPFGHGPRACIARRLAEQTLQALLLRLVREYRLSWHGGELGVRSLLINKPDQPVLIGLTKRQINTSS